MPAPTSRKLAMVQRRQKVSDLYIRGWTQTAIATQLGVKQSTISEDLRQIAEVWRESSIRNFDAARDLELEKLQLIEREAWLAWDRSQQPLQMATVDGNNASGRSRRTVRHQYGDPRFLEVMLHCSEARRQILGLDAPTKIAPTTPDGAPLTLEQRSICINAILSERFGLKAILQHPATEVLDHDPTATPPVPGTIDRRGTAQAQPDDGPSDPCP